MNSEETPLVRSWLVGVVACVTTLGCAGTNARSQCALESIRTDIAAVLDESVRATRAQDIDAYMALIPDESLIDDTGGEQITRDQLRANVIRDWAVIPETLAIEHTIEAITLTGCDGAEVMTGQRWERLMLRPNNQLGTDRILTTQRHRETWRRTPNGWRAIHIEELGGEVYVNGELYSPN